MATLSNETTEFRIAAQPDRLLMIVPRLSGRRARSIANEAVRLTRVFMPKLTGQAYNRIFPIYGKGYFGVGFLDSYVWFQENGIRPFTMVALSGKTIPMWVNDPTGTEQQRNPRAKTRVTMSGIPQVLIFRRVARMGQTKVVRTKNKISGEVTERTVPMCYDDQTDVLTRDGYKPWEQVMVTDELATLNPESGEIEYQRPMKIFSRFYEGEMYRVKSKHVDLVVTPDHRMWVTPDVRDPFRIENASAIAGKSRAYQLTGIWTGEHPYVYKIPLMKTPHFNAKQVREIDSAIWASFLGIYLSEGSVAKKGRDYAVYISQYSGPKKDAMRPIMEAMPYGFREYAQGWQCVSRQLYETMKPFGHSSERYAPDYLKTWSSELISRFIRFYRLGDGSKDGIYTSSLRMRDDICELALKSGYASRYVLDLPAGTPMTIKGTKTKTNHDSWLIYLNRTHLYPMVDLSPLHVARQKTQHYGDGLVDYSGMVYCASVPNGLLFVRRGGRTIVSGNSYPGAPGRIGKRETGQPWTTEGKAGGAIAQGNVGVRWRHPGLAPRKFMNHALTLAAQRAGILPVRIYAADRYWRNHF